MHTSVSMLIPLFRLSFVGISFPTDAFSADYCEGLFGTDSARFGDVADCSDIVPCSKWVKLEPSETNNKQTCKEYCELSDDLTCVASWKANENDSTDKCKAVAQSTCDQEYGTATPVVCVCAQVAKCTLFTKCDKQSKVSNKIAMFDTTEFNRNRGKGFSIDPRMSDCINSC